MNDTATPSVKERHLGSEAAFAGKFLQVLGDEDLTREDLQRVISDRSLRRSVAAIVRQDEHHPGPELRDTIYRKPIEELVEHVWPELSFLFRGPGDRAARADMRESMIDVFTDRDRLVEWLDFLNPRARGIIIWSHQLEAGKSKPPEEVADYYGLKLESVQDIARRARRTLAAKSDAVSWHRDLHEGVTAVPVEALDLREQTKNRLLRAGIYTVDRLIPKSAIDLLRLPGFGEEMLKEVQARLAVFELTLRD